MKFKNIIALNRRPHWAASRYSILIGAGLALASGAHAATQGTLGATSQGSANISVTKSVQAQISDLQDMTLSNWSVGQGAVDVVRQCPYLFLDRQLQSHGVG